MAFISKAASKVNGTANRGQATSGLGSLEQCLSPDAEFSAITRG